MSCKAEATFDERAGHINSGGPSALGRGRRLSMLLILAALLYLTGAGKTSPAAAAVDPCPNAEFRVGLSAQLPDCRAYEQVSPPEKGNYGAIPRDNFGRISGMYVGVDGRRISYFTLEASFADPEFPGGNYLATRASSGWSSKNLTPPQSTASALTCPLNIGAGPFSADLSKAVFSNGDEFGLAGTCGRDDPPLVPGEPVGVQNLFLRDNLSHTYQLISPNPLAGAPAPARIWGASEDLSHVVFTEAAQLTADAPAGVDNLYEWSDGELRLVTQVPVAPDTSCSGSECVPVQGDLPTLNRDASTYRRFVSTDGSQIVFKAGGKLYARLDGTTTVQLDSPAPDAPGPGGGDFMWAGDSKVFFVASPGAGLTVDTVAGSGSNLYVYDTETTALTNLTPFSDVGVRGVSAASEDGSRVYFVAGGALAPGATAAESNLYVSDHGEITWIATLGQADYDRCVWDIFNCAASFGIKARASSDGSFFGFSSSMDLTGSSSGGYSQLYLYDAAEDELSCASCVPSGQTPSTDVTFPAPERALWNDLSTAQYLQRFVSDNGRLFFTTVDPLVPEDTNGRQDAYEYENGQRHLLSTGTSGQKSYVFDASPSGDDVLIGTYQQLVPQDQDTAADSYTVRVGGGLASQHERPRLPCAGDDCQGVPRPAPGVARPGTSGFVGSGNQGQAEKPRPKGSARPKGQRKACKTIKNKRERRSCVRKRKACKRVENKRARSECGHKQRRGNK